MAEDRLARMQKRLAGYLRRSDYGLKGTGRLAPRGSLPQRADSKEHELEYLFQHALARPALTGCIHGIYISFVVVIGMVIGTATHGVNASSSP